jgi:NTP pyrophosphatase (non-canonical NTP hydrolase)
MTEPSELRGDVISREAAIEALVRAEVAANRSGAGELDNTRARAYSDGEAAGLHFATNLLRALSALPSVPEPPNDAKTLNEMMAEIVEFEHGKGWQPNDNRFLESLALLHSEISEALEAYRDKDWGSVRESDGKPEGVTSELADTFIRLLSTWAQFLTPLGHDLEEQYERKMAYNRTRPYRHGGRTI